MIEDKHNRQQNKIRPVFLATTALEDFWDTSKIVIFLGEWCLLHKPETFGKCIGREVIPSPWIDSERFTKACDYTQKIHENILPVLAERLNKIHNTTFSLRYWRIVIGPWLLYYIPSLYDRYISLKIALERFPDITTIGLSEESFIVPRDTNDFIKKIFNDLYNLQLFTKILVFLGYDFPKKKLTAFENAHAPRKNLIDICKVIASRMQTSINRALKNNDSVIFKESYLTNYENLIMFLSTRGKVLIEKTEFIEIPMQEVNINSRGMLNNLLKNDNEFSSLLNTLLPFEIPQSFIEGYTSLRKAIANRYCSSPKAIFSANSWYFDEAFKLWAAESAEKGTRLIGTQHGGNYGISKYMPPESHEIAISDTYLSWGWGNSAEKKIIPARATYLSRLENIGADNTQFGILTALWSFDRYLFNLSGQSYYLADYLDQLTTLVSGLTTEKRSQTRFRFFDRDYDFATKFKARCPDISIEFCSKKPFLKSLKNCRLFVCSSLGTVHAEALASNKPTVLFWNTSWNINIVREEAVPYFEGLKESGVLFDNPDAAAKAINLIYPNVESWWNDIERQSMRRKFCERYARTSANSLIRWKEEFNKLI